MESCESHFFLKKAMGLTEYDLLLYAPNYRPYDTLHADTLRSLLWTAMNVNKYNYILIARS